MLEKKELINEKIYVQYGCGLSAPDEWLNFDASPTLRINKTPIIGSLLKKKVNTIFPNNVLYGDITKGLPLEVNSVDGIYCSHILEHLSLEDFRIALQNTYRIMKKGARFRCVLPDLEYTAKNYLDELSRGVNNASLDFIRTTKLGLERRPKGIKGFATSFFGNSQHLWMWDAKSLLSELKRIGFSEIRQCEFNDSGDVMFNYVEDQARFLHSISFECKK